MRLAEWLACAAVLTGSALAQRRRGRNRNRDREGITLNPGPNECLYTFTIPNTEFRDTCRTAEVEDLIAELEKSNDALKEANDDLKKDIQSIRDDYQSMVDAVSLLETETTTWREIIEWPKIDPRFEPENDSIVIVTDPVYPDCWAAHQDGQTKQGIYTLEPENAVLPFLAYCDEDGWTVFQRRFGGDEDEALNFFRNWDDYSGGFGRLSGEFWLGLENIHLITAQKDYQLKVELVGWNNKFYTSFYDDFRLQSEATNYALSVGNYTGGNYVDVLTNLNGRPFSTFDFDNDDWPSANCANYYQGGWWLDQCGFDLHRPWCEGTGCMSWGDRNVKKSILKLRPMSAKGTPDKKKTNKVIRIKKVKRRRNRHDEEDEDEY